MKISISEPNTRVSYNDLLLFLAITKSFSSENRDDNFGKEPNLPLSLIAAINAEHELLGLDPLKSLGILSREDNVCDKGHKSSLNGYRYKSRIGNMPKLHKIFVLNEK